MSDFKSKLPDLKELGSMTGKLFHDLKTSVCGIIDEYKKKRKPVVKPAATTKPTAEEPKKETVKKEKPATSAKPAVKKDDKPDKAKK